MKKATITVSLNNKTFQTSFEVAEDVKEYEIADEAYRVGLLFADTQMIAAYGRRMSSAVFADFIRNLDYDYKIEEV